MKNLGKEYEHLAKNLLLRLYCYSRCDLYDPDDFTYV